MPGLIAASGRRLLKSRMVEEFLFEMMVQFTFVTSKMVQLSVEAVSS